MIDWRTTLGWSMARSMRASWASSRIPPPSNVPGETRGGDGGGDTKETAGRGGVWGEKEEEEEEEEEGWSKTPTSLFSSLDSLLFSL